VRPGAGTKDYGAYRVVFTPDGKSLVTGHDRNKIVITPIK
jgi:hypothetical protein